MRLFTTLLFATPFLLHADPNLVKEVTRAVDGVYFKAFILPVGTEDRLVVRLYEPRRMAEFSLLSQDGQNGSHIENIQWSKDGKFLIFPLAVQVVTLLGISKHMLFPLIKIHFYL